jgi:hypothetical protein
VWCQTLGIELVENPDWAFMLGYTITVCGSAIPRYYLFIGNLGYPYTRIKKIKIKKHVKREKTRISAS